MKNRKHKNGNGKSRYQQKRPQYLKVGSIVYTHVNAGMRKDKRVHLCEARIIRHPNFVGGPYKLLITGIQIRSEKDSIPQGILGLRLRRQDSGIIRTLNAFTSISGEHWVRLDQNKSDELLKRAISFIKKEKKLQAIGKNAWLNYRPRKR